MDFCSVPLPCSNKLPKRQGAKRSEGAVAVAVLAVTTTAPAPAPAVDWEAASPVAPFVLLHRQRPSTVGRGARTRVRSEAGEGAGNSMLLFSNVSEADQA